MESMLLLCCWWWHRLADSMCWGSVGGSRGTATIVQAALCVLAIGVCHGHGGCSGHHEQHMSPALQDARHCRGEHPHLAILHVVLQASASMVGWAGSSLLLLVTSYSSVSTSPNVHVSDQQSLWHTWIGSTSCCMSRPPFQGFPASVVACPVPCTAVPVQWCRQR